MQALTVRHPGTLYLPNSVTKNEVIEVARGAQETVLLGKEAPPDKLGLRQRLRDWPSGGVKKMTKSQIHDLSHHTAALHLELEKPEDRRNRLMVNTHVEQIYLKQKNNRINTWRYTRIWAHRHTRCCHQSGVWYPGRPQ